MGSTYWHDVIAEQMRLPRIASRQLRDDGFAVVPGPRLLGGIPRLQRAYDRAVAEADATDISVGSSTRVKAFVNGGPEFDGIYIFPPLLAACCQITGRPFKLSGMRARTLEPGAPVEALHVDVKHNGDGWPIVGFIWMVDAFTSDNGATRFVPGTHRDPRDPRSVLDDAKAPHDKQVVARGPAGALIIFDGSVWHSHTSNTRLRVDARCRAISFLGMRERLSIIRLAYIAILSNGSMTWPSTYWRVPPNQAMEGI